MEVLFTHHVTDADRQASVLAECLGLQPYDARQLANLSSPGPTVAGTFPETGAADAALEALSAARLPAFKVTDDQIEGPAQRFLGRRIEFTQQGAVIESRAGDLIQVFYSDVALLVRAVGITDFTSTDVQTSRKLSIGRALVSGGLVMTKKVSTTTTSNETRRSGLLYVHRPGEKTVALHEDELQYDGLGDHMKPTRMLNFKFVCEQLRARCSTAVWDDRLMNRAQQVRLLGPKFPPEQFLDLATTALSRALLNRI